MNTLAEKELCDICGGLSSRVESAVVLRAFIDKDSRLLLAVIKTTTSICYMQRLLLFDNFLLGMVSRYSMLNITTPAGMTV
ncbi:hypothetical protein vseg_004294 [Gypsophila vaccaria]